MAASASDSLFARAATEIEWQYLTESLTVFYLSVFSVFQADRLLIRHESSFSDI